MKRIFVGAILVIALYIPLRAQKGTPEPDFYPVGFSGSTWTGEVIEFDNQNRTLTLSTKKGKTPETFVAVIPDLPYQWLTDMQKVRVVDFPFDIKTDPQLYKYRGSGEFGGDYAPPGGSDMKRIPNPPADQLITEFDQFKGRKVTVFYTVNTRKVNGQDEKFNDVWRIRVFKK